MRERRQEGQQRVILSLLLRKYRADPEKFRSYLPEVAQELEQLLPKRRGTNRGSVLTEPERERLQRTLFQLVKKKQLSREDAIRALEYCGTLIRDASLPSELGRDVVLDILRRATGIPLSKTKKAARIPVREGEPTKEVAVLRGVHLHLTWNDRLVAISISPGKVKERSKALRFVGIAKDIAADVAQRHDAYLAEAICNAAP